MNAKEPISLDMILVCKKQDQVALSVSEEDMEKTLSRQIKRVENGDSQISKSDRFNIRASLLLVAASRSSLSGECLENLIREGQEAETR